ncbi:MAG TPA: hypothetical protein VLH60_07110, partial [Sedimentisphaerales bacterium]|nr:hypothetical protein [Sedimentisphaerales bacterium]
MMKESVYTVCSQFNMDRVLSSYVQKLYVPAVKSSQAISANNYKTAKEVSQEEAELVRCWDGIRITECSCDADRKQHIVEGQELTVTCTVEPGQARLDMLAGELFYMHQEGTEYEVMRMGMDKHQDGKAHYSTKFAIKGYGLQSFNVRVRPANPLVVDCNPELIKWNE